MDVKVNAGCLTQAITTDEIVSFANEIADEFRQQRNASRGSATVLTLVNNRF